jgi:hypothetical protein
MVRSGASREAFVQALGGLSSAQAKNLAEAAHGVDPDSTNTYPQEHEYDEYAGIGKDEFRNTYLPALHAEGKVNPYMWDPMPFIRPHSIAGMINYIKRTGIPLPV